MPKKQFTSSGDVIYSYSTKEFAIVKFFKTDQHPRTIDDLSKCIGIPLTAQNLKGLLQESLVQKLTDFKICPTCGNKYCENLYEPTKKMLTSMFWNMPKY